LKQHLSTLIPFLIRELQHPQKLVRAISLWTLSRFTKFILVDNLSDNSHDVFKEYLCEILKRFLDKETIVQEAACTAFTSMMQTKKERLEPYLFDIFKIITSVFDTYTGTSLLTLYEIISHLSEYFEDHFTNPNLINDLVNCVVKKWYNIVNSDDMKNISPVFDMLCSIIKVSSHLMIEFTNDFLANSIRLIEINIKNYKSDPNQLDKEIISKSIDLISTLCQCLTEVIKSDLKKNRIVDVAYEILELDNTYLKHYVIALFGDLAKVDATLLIPKFDKLMEILIKNLDLSNKFDSMEIEKISVCNNSCWTIGLITLSLQEQIRVYIPTIIKSLIKVLSFPKVKLFNFSSINHLLKT
jgi:transportin-1